MSLTLAPINHLHCKICKSSFSRQYIFSEKMFGFGNEFAYHQCSFCGCLQIEELPNDISKYYPPYYYSFTQEIPALKKHSLLKKMLANFSVNKIYRKSPELLKFLKKINIKPSNKILDIGCGKGQLICELFNSGFTNVGGIDKFLPTETDHGFGVKILKKDLVELPQSSYDLIMMNHVLEHMEEQQQALVDCRKLLKDDGCLLIRIPILGDAWEIYKENWVQLDAPRHFILHTVKSMDILAKDTGFEIKWTVFDSTNFQFLGSELYKRKLPLFSKEHDYKPYPMETLFAPQEIAAFNQKTNELNALGRGDSAAFFLFKK